MKMKPLTGLHPFAADVLQLCRAYGAEEVGRVTPCARRVKSERAIAIGGGQRTARPT